MRGCLEQEQEEIMRLKNLKQMVAQIKDLTPEEIEQLQQLQEAGSSEVCSKTREVIKIAEAVKTKIEESKQYQKAFLLKVEELKNIVSLKSSSLNLDDFKQKYSEIDKLLQEEIRNSLPIYEKIEDGMELLTATYKEIEQLKELLPFIITPGQLENILPKLNIALNQIKQLKDEKEGLQDVYKQMGSDLKNIEQSKNIAVEAKYIIKVAKEGKNTKIGLKASQQEFLRYLERFESIAEKLKNSEVFSSEFDKLKKLLEIAENKKIKIQKDLSEEIDETNKLDVNTENLLKNIQSFIKKDQHNPLQLLLATAKNEVKALKEQAEDLQTGGEEINRKLEELQGKVTFLTTEKKPEKVRILRSLPRAKEPFYPSQAKDSWSDDVSLAPPVRQRPPTALLEKTHQFMPPLPIRREGSEVNRPFAQQGSFQQGPLPRAATVPVQPRAYTRKDDNGLSQPVAKYSSVYRLPFSENNPYKPTSRSSPHTHPHTHPHPSAGGSHVQPTTTRSSFAWR